ncbi:hypothetical protein P175DRAFT_0507165 [Aspergillus ochraceoroseus IBT 24754]|uniref:FAD-binding PCMH-type domain-containing protein n=2 Tax=Aspergillus ochraceoroseus TaxID=138278 RepID=A0A2T5M1A8_9EURO|nr:uncharacterized protein P175DRAFT_0507165 [Aspergillus ochraceoroseus IBT 24754]KKK21133.1 hypothetical protein AOCH_002936 [Aspergillus ochraceoroseus]PTU22308.1 hypothetical protein P175DRAFT_0507165 [Aspergillus ochraceoroseus IBT 24754]
MSLKFLTALAVLGSVNAIALAPRASVGTVSDQDWDTFNASVSGRLYNGEPMLAPCYTNYNGEPQVPNLEECIVVQGKKGDPTFITGQFGGYMNTQWGGCQATGQSCVVGSLGPDILSPILKRCDQGSVPYKYVEVQSVEDIQETLQFADKNHLRLVIKNTGHDYEGRSSAPDSLALWMHKMQPPIELEKQFIPDSCSETRGDAITFGAGQQFEGIYEFTETYGYRVVGGSSRTVGAAGGWITGGGHSVLSNELGLGVDNVQQLKAVLPNGTYITANRCQNQDLFFALRGGGGGTFGVITEMTTLVHPKRPMQFVEMGFTTLGAAATSKLMSILVANAEKWASEGWGGFVSSLNLGTSVFMSTALLSHEEAVESMKPLSDFATDFNLGIVNITTSSDYLAGMQNFFDIEELQEALVSASTISSRIVRRESFVGEENQKQLASLLNDFVTVDQKILEPSLQISVLCITAPTLYSQNMPESDQPGGPGAASVTPAWRDGIWHVLQYRSFDSTITDPKTVQSIVQNAHEVMNPLREFTPGSGAYINEADPFEPDSINSFWGQENYARLLEIKKEIDPTNLLMVHNGVGWDETDGRFACFPDIDTAA